MKNKDLVEELRRLGKNIPFRLLESEKLLDAYIKKMMKEIDESDFTINLGEYSAKLFYNG